MKRSRPEDFEESAARELKRSRQAASLADTLADDTSVLEPAPAPAPDDRVGLSKAKDITSESRRAVHSRLRQLAAVTLGCSGISEELRKASKNYIAAAGTLYELSWKHGKISENVNATANDFLNKLKGEAVVIGENNTDAKDMLDKFAKLDGLSSPAPFDDLVRQEQERNAAYQEWMNSLAVYMRKNSYNGKGSEQSYLELEKDEMQQLVGFEDQYDGIKDEVFYQDENTKENFTLKDLQKVSANAVQDAVAATSLVEAFLLNGGLIERKSIDFKMGSQEKTRKKVKEHLEEKQFDTSEELAREIVKGSGKVEETSPDFERNVQKTRAMIDGSGLKNFKKLMAMQAMGLDGLKNRDADLKSHFGYSNGSEILKTESQHWKERVIKHSNLAKQANIATRASMLEELPSEGLTHAEMTTDPITEVKVLHTYHSDNGKLKMKSQSSLTNPVMVNALIAISRENQLRGELTPDQKKKFVKEQEEHYNNVSEEMGAGTGSNLGSLEAMAAAGNAAAGARAAPSPWN